MRGSPVTTPKIKKGYPLTQSAALEIFLILLIPLFIAAVHVYRLGVKTLSSYEANQLKTMLTRSAETGTELIQMEGRKTAEEGLYLDLAAAMEKIDAIDFASIDNQQEGESGWNKSTVSLEQADLELWYVVVRGDGRTLLVDDTAGTSRELGEAELLYTKCSEAAEDTKAVQWEDNGAYFCLFLQTVDGPLTFDESPLLYNVADANIGMLVKGNLSFVEASVRERVLLYVLTLFGLLLLIIAAMCISVHSSLRVLRDMSGIMQRYRLSQNPDMEELKKRLSVVKRRARDDELKDLTESFYAMAVNLIDYQDTVDSIKNQYEPFVPEALLSLFNKEYLPDIQPGDTAEFSGSLLKVRFESCDTADSRPLSEAVCEIISSKGGIILHIAESELEAVFPVYESCADDTDTYRAQHAGEEASELIQNLIKDKTADETSSIKLKHGIFCLHIIGSDKRMAIRLTEKGSCNGWG